MIGKTFQFVEAGWRDERKIMYFRYRIETDEQGFELEETITLPGPIADCAESERLLRALHLALGTSYYKAFIPPLISHPYAMTVTEASFWDIVYRHGLGEFLYTNQLSAERLATFPAQDGSKAEGESISTWQDEALLGIGGGKDSALAGELLKAAGITPTGFVLATGEILGQTQAVSDVMGINLLAVKRAVDQQILEINHLPGAYNGHIPISLIFGLVGSMLAVGRGSRYVVVANEASASIPQTQWEGVAVNHQWSKSLEFERFFQDYLRAYVSDELHYFSAIRPLSSVAVAKIFSGYPEYFEVFTSDNSLFKIKQAEREHPRWSRESSKTLSSCMLLSAWLPAGELIRIFGQNYLEDKGLAEMCVNLLGAGSQAVLDCVGTPDELRLSLALAAQKIEYADASLVTLTRDKNLLGNPADLDKYLQFGEHAIPDSLQAQLLGLMEQKL